MKKVIYGKEIYTVLSEKDFFYILLVNKENKLYKCSWIISKDICNSHNINEKFIGMRGYKAMTSNVTEIDLEKGTKKKLKI